MTDILKENHFSIEYFDEDGLDEVMDLTGLEFKEVRKEQAIKANELLKTCPKEQAKLARQLRKLGLL